MKGQKSLEMIIGLVMLLVVASVTISMFLNVFQEPDFGDETVEKQEIENTCSSKCSQFKEASGREQLSAALDYCTSKFSRDVNQDGSANDVAGAGYNSYCEDGIKCFNAHTCETGINEELDAERCRQLMCQYYTEVNKDPYDIEKEDNVHRHIQEIMSPENEETGIGTCGLATATDSADYEISTWYDPNGQEYRFSGGPGNDNQQLPADMNPENAGEGYTCGEQFDTGSSESGGGEVNAARELCKNNGYSDVVSDLICVSPGKQAFFGEPEAFYNSTGGTSSNIEFCESDEVIGCTS